MARRAPTPPRTGVPSPSNASRRRRCPFLLPLAFAAAAARSPFWCVRQPPRSHACRVTTRQGRLQPSCIDRRCKCPRCGCVVHSGQAAQSGKACLVGYGRALAQQQRSVVLAGWWAVHGTPWSGAGEGSRAMSLAVPIHSRGGAHHSACVQGRALKAPPAAVHLLAGVRTRHIPWISHQLLSWTVF